MSVWTLLLEHLEPVPAGDATPLQAQCTARNHPPDIPVRLSAEENDHEPVHRSPCEVAQCLAPNPANTARAGYGTHQQLRRIMTTPQWTRDRGYPAVVVTTDETCLLFGHEETVSTGGQTVIAPVRPVGVLYRSGRERGFDHA